MIKKIMMVCVCIALISVVSGSSKNLSVKADTISPDQSTTSPQLTEDTKNAPGTLNINDVEEELLDLANTNHITIIAYACSYYLAAYRTMPENLDALLDGFTFLWPGSVWTGKPIKILEAMPDPLNPDHIDGVFYEFINDHTAKLYYLLKNPFSSGASDEWEIGESKIEPATQGITDDGSWSEGDELTAMEPEERFWFGFQGNLQLALPPMMYDSKSRRPDVIEENIVDLMRNSQFFILEPGLATLKSGINAEKAKFDIGTISGTRFYYYYYSDFNGNLTPCCFDDLKSDFMTNPEYCSGLTAGKNAIFNSENFDPSIFPDDLIITKYDVH